MKSLVVAFEEMPSLRRNPQQRHKSWKRGRWPKGRVRRNVRVCSDRVVGRGPSSVLPL